MPSPIDVAALRAATPGTAHVAHLNNAGAGLMSAATLAAVHAHLDLEATIGGYEAADRAAAARQATRANAAALLGGAPDEVAIVANDTAAFAKAFWGFVLGGGLRGGGRILVDRVAYGSHYFATRQSAALADVTVEVVPSHDDGTLDVEALRRPARRRRAPRVGHPRAHPPGVGEPGRRGRRGVSGRGRAVLPRRLPVGGSAPGRRRCHRLRRAHRHRAQVAARAARHRACSTCGAASSSASTRSGSTASARRGHPTATC